MKSRQYLELMGIDVWRRRPPRKAKAVATDPAQLPSIGPEKARLNGSSSLVRAKQTLDSAQQNVAGDPNPAKINSLPTIAVGPSFLLVFVNFPGLTMASVYSADLARQPDHHQRFLSSLYFALTGNKSTTNVTDFRWPMVKSAHISQSKDEARQVLQQSLDRVAERILAFGDGAAELIHDQPLPAYQSAILIDKMPDKASAKTLWVLPEIEHFFLQTRERKALWQGLKELRGALQSE
jgi:hypothetical protein